MATVMHQGKKKKSIPPIGHSWHLSHLHLPIQAKTKRKCIVNNGANIRSIIRTRRDSGAMLPFHLF
jgi:hypothetical protein